MYKRQISEMRAQETLFAITMPRCAMCNEIHLTKNCSRKEISPYVTCVNCKGNHTKKYKGCAIYQQKCPPHRYINFTWLQTLQPRPYPQQNLIQMSNTPTTRPYQIPFRLQTFVLLPLQLKDGLKTHERSKHIQATTIGIADK